MSITIPITAKLAGAIAAGGVTSVPVPRSATVDRLTGSAGPSNDPADSVPTALSAPADARASLPGQASGARLPGAGPESAAAETTPIDADDVPQFPELGQRIRQAVQDSKDVSSPLTTQGTGSIIIYGDVHMPAVQHVQPPQDKTQPPLVRGGDQDHTPQAF